MNRCFISIVMSVLFFCVLPAYGKSIHDNHVYFLNFAEGDMVAGIGFNLKHYSITGGQPWGGISTGMDHYDDSRAGYIDVRAGRHGSEDVANWFKARVNLAVATRQLEWDPDNDRPHKLNFAIIGDLVLKAKGSPPNGGSVLCRDIVIGQGHVGAYNNWWIGGKNTNMHAQYYGNTWLECPPVDGHCGGVVIFWAAGGHSDVLEVDLLLCPVQDDTPDPEHIPRYR